ncbi:MAG: GAF domain-containing protein [Chloroflexi bacterium]|nr:GAF domain-containing protein [Chloroflexota bacterium]
MLGLEREKEQLQAELRRRQQHATLLREIALASRGGVNPQQVFQTIFERLSEVLPVDAFFVALCDNENPEQYRFVLFIDEGKTFDLRNSRVGGIAGYLLEHKQPMLFRDLHQEFQQTGAPPPERFGNVEKRSRSWMGVPILIGRDAVGVISAQSYEYGVYDESDLELLIALGDLASVAIENAILYRAQEELSQSLVDRVTARSEELAVLTAIAVTFSQGQPLNMLLDEVLERVLWLLGMNAGAIFLHERRTLMHRAAWRADGAIPMPAEWLPIEGTSRVATAMSTGHFVEDVRDSYAVMAMPLRAHGQTVGVLTLHGPARSLTEHEHTLLEAASYQIAVGIENARLLTERERQIAQLEALTDIAASSASTLDLQAMLEQVYTSLRKLLPIDGFIAATLNTERSAFNMGVTWNSETEMMLLAHLPVDTSTRLSHMLADQKPMLLRHTDPQHYQIRPRQGWERGAMSWLGVPLLSRENKTIGVLAIQSQRPDAFDRRDQQFLSAVAHQLALNVENAQLYQTARSSAAIAERRADNLTLVHSISRLVNSSLNPQEVLGIAAEQLVKLIGVDYCAITIYTGSGWNGDVVAEYPALGALGRHVAFDNAEDFEDDVQIMGQPVYIAQLLHDPRSRPVRALAEQLGMESMLIVPLISRGRAIGAIGMTSRSKGRLFSAEELELCRTVAAQVAIALENARLFQLSVTRIEQEMEIARSIQANLFPRSLPTIPGADLAARCVPARETGGDFYDVLPLDHSRFGLSVGDVSGKSLPAAMVMAAARSIVRSEALDHPLPEDVMDQTNMLITQDVPQDMYVALCYAVYDAGQRSLELALGGQLTPLLRKPDGSVSFIEASSNLPLGIVPSVHYVATNVRLEQGDTVLLYTDGLVEAFSPDGELFGFERLQATFAACGDLPAETIVEQLFAAVTEWHAGVERHDDITTVVLRVL